MRNAIFLVIISFCLGFLACGILNKLIEIEQIEEKLDQVNLPNGKVGKIITINNQDYIFYEDYRKMVLTKID